MVLLFMLFSQSSCLCVGHFTRQCDDWWIVYYGIFCLFCTFPKFFFCGVMLVCAIKKNVSSCAIPVDSVFTSIGFAGISPLIFRIIFSLGSNSERDQKSAGVFIFPGERAMVKLNCKTTSQAFHKGGGINSIWKNLVTGLVSVMIIIGLVALPNKCTNPWRPDKWVIGV